MAVSQCHESFDIDNSGNGGSFCNVYAANLNYKYSMKIKLKIIV